MPRADCLRGPFIALLVTSCMVHGGCAGTPVPRGGERHPYWLADLEPPPLPTGALGQLLNAGREALEKGDYAAATKAFEHAMAKEPGRVGVATEWAMALRAGGRPGRALDRLNAPLASRVPSIRLRARLVRVNVLMDLGDVANAWRESQHIVNDAPQLLDGHYALARALLASGRRRQALASFDTVRRFDPDHFGAQMGALAALSVEPKGMDYRTLEHHVLRRWPRQPDVHVIRGVAREIMGEPDEAIAAYREALSFDAGHSTANFNLARLLEERQGLHAAIPHYSRFINSASGPRRKVADKLRRRLRKQASPGDKNRSED